MNLFRKRYRRASVLRRILLLAPRRADEEAAPDSGLLLSEALRALTPRQRAALVLTELVGCSAEEAARVLKVKPSTIGALKYQGRAALRREEERTDD